MPALWDGDLPAAQPVRQARARDASADRPAGAGISRSPGREASGEHDQSSTSARAGQGPPGPPWPSSPRSGSRAPAREAPQHADRAQLRAQHRVTGAAREPRTRPQAAADDPEPAAERAADVPAARWPVPNPRTAREPQPPGQEATQEAAAIREPAGRRQPGTGAATDRPGPGSAEPGGPGADWRDHILSEARQPWQAAPSWPHNPAVHRIPGADPPDTGIELGR
jgi:hypothetical protein